jgi:hypothetical protein
MRIRTMGAVVLCTMLAGLLAGCGGDDDDAASPDASASTATATATTDGSTAGGSESGGSGSGSVTLDGEAITLASVRCTLEPQDSAAGGGQILFVGQGEGAAESGVEILIDVSRYDEASMFAGDSVSLTMGDPTDPDSETLELMGATDAISVDGSTLGGTDLQLADPEGTYTRTVSFELNC